MTVGDLKKILATVPDDYTVNHGNFRADGVTIKPDTKKVVVV